MNRLLSIATILFSYGIVAAAPAPPVKKPATVGDKVVLATTPSSGPVTILPQPRLGDPDKPDFESGCQLVLPFEVEVLGLLQEPGDGHAIVVEYRTPDKTSRYFRCNDGAILLFTQEGWDKLKAAEAAVAKERADQERRREEIRKILRQRGRSAARK